MSKDDGWDVLDFEQTVDLPLATFCSRDLPVEDIFEFIDRRTSPKKARGLKIRSWPGVSVLFACQEEIDDYLNRVGISSCSLLTDKREIYRFLQRRRDSDQYSYTRRVMMHQARWRLRTGWRIQLQRHSRLSDSLRRLV